MLSTAAENKTFDLNFIIMSLFSTTTSHPVRGLMILRISCNNKKKKKKKNHSVIGRNFTSSNNDGVLIYYMLTSSVSFNFPQFNPSLNQAINS